MPVFNEIKSSLSYRITYNFFYLVCTSATLFFILFCLYQFSLNKDLSQITYQEFQQNDENIYPSLTLCFANIFYEENFKSYGLNTSDDYSWYLTGDYWVSNG